MSCLLVKETRFHDGITCRLRRPLGEMFDGHCDGHTRGPVGQMRIHENLSSESPES